MIALGQLRKKFKNFLIRKFDVFFSQLFWNDLRTVEKKNIPFKALRNPTVIFYVLYNNFFYVLLSCLFHLKKDFYSVHDNTDAFCLSYLQKDFEIFHEPFCT